MQIQRYVALRACVSSPLFRIHVLFKHITEYMFKHEYLFCLNIQIYVNSLARVKSDLTEGRRRIQVARIRDQGRGFITQANKILRQNGIKLCHSFLARSPVIDSALMTWGNDELHQDFLGTCCKKMQKFMIKTGAPFGSPARRRIIDYWLALWRNQGIARRAYQLSQIV